VSTASIVLVLVVLAMVGAGLVWAAAADRRRGEEIQEDLSHDLYRPKRWWRR